MSTIIYDKRLSFMTAGQAGNIVIQDVAINQQVYNSNRQVVKCVGQAGFISLTQGLSLLGSVSIKGKSAREMHHLGFSSLMDYNW